jgi:phospholipid-binding lipoprotein MlaA
VRTSHPETDYVQIDITVPLEGIDGYSQRVDAAPGVRESNARPWRHALRMLVALLTVITLVQLDGCASVPRGGDAGVYDPLEPMNRAVFKANMALDRAFVKPIAQGYRAILPEFVRDRFHSFVENLIEPRIFINDLLQFRLNAAGMTFARFLMNTTVGLGGLFDPASKHGLPRQTGDFGQTLYMYGVSPGPYLVLPFFGPSNVRDGVGLGLDLFTEGHTNPLNAAVTENRSTVNWTLGIVYGIDLRARNIETLEAIEANSIDLYATLRSISQQHRDAELRKAKGLEPELEPLIDPEAPEQ